MTRFTGLRRATEEQRSAVRLYQGAPMAAYRAAASLPIQLPIERIIDQGSLPACVGAAMCACAESVLGDDPRRSWVRIWTDARRRDGSLADAEQGTYFSSAIESVMRRGLDPEEPGEADSRTEQTQPDDLDSEMAAFDERQTDAEHWRIPDGDLDAVIDALGAGMGVGIGAGVRDGWFNFFGSPRKASDPDVVLTSAALGGNSSGHEQRIVDVRVENARRLWTIQNSWGLNGGCHRPDDSFQLGCALVDDSAIRAAWDLDAIKITRRVPGKQTAAQKRDLVNVIARAKLGLADPSPFWARCQVPRPFPPAWCGGFALSCLIEAGLCRWPWLFATATDKRSGFLYRLSPPRRRPDGIGDIAYFEKHQHHAIVGRIDGDSVELINGNGEGGRVSLSTKNVGDVTAFYSIGRLL
jgi:hypothetical protein